MNRRFNYAILFTCFWFIGTAQVRQERDYNQSYSVDNGGSVEIVSKYGEVIVRTWDLDSVMFDVLVRAEGKNDEVVRKSMSRVDIRFRKVGKMISAETSISSGGGLLGRVSSGLEGVVGNNKLTINYQVWIPENIVLSIENKYGDVYLTDLQNKVNLTVAHGDIKAGNLMGDLTLTHQYGKASFGKIQSSITNLRGSKLQVEEARTMNFESGSSEIRINKIAKAHFNSRNDDIRLLEVQELDCEGSFTDIVLERLNGRALLDFSYGDIYVSNIKRDFESIEITGKSTDINLILNQASFISTYIKGDEDKMILPNSMLLLKKDNFDEDDKVVLSGDVGPPNAVTSDLRVETEGGKLIVSIKETPLFSDKN